MEPVRRLRLRIAQCTLLLGRNSLCVTTVAILLSSGCGCAHVKQEWQSPTLSPTPAASATLTPSGKNFASIDYSNTTITDNSDLFGGVSSNTDLTLGSTIGLKLIRMDYYMSRIVPHGGTCSSNGCVADLTVYRDAMAAGCPSGSMCDPSTWTWNQTDCMVNARNAGFKILGIMCYILSFDSTTGTPFGNVIDWNVYEDVVKKITQHFAADMIEQTNEPDTCNPTLTQCLNATDNATQYYHMAHAIRSVNATVPIGGPSTAAPHTDFLDAIHANRGILPSWVNFVSFHWYTGNYNVDTSMNKRAHQYWPGIPIIVSEWNWDGTCQPPTQTPMNEDDPSTVGWLGAEMISDLANGNGATFYQTSKNADGSCASFDANGNLLPKMYVYRLMSQKLGLGAGASQVKSTTMAGISNAVGAINSAGQLIAVIANWFSSQTVTVYFNNLPLSGNHVLNLYVADHSGNTASTPYATSNINIRGGSLVYTFTIPAYSTAGIVIQ